MLRQVLFYIRKQKQIEREVKEALEGNLEVLWLEDMEKIRRQSLEDKLLVTDCADQELPEEFLEMPRLGYGLEYRGSAEYVVENVILQILSSACNHCRNGKAFDSGNECAGFRWFVCIV